MTSTFLSTNPSYIAPFALLMQASASHIGILGAIEILFPALSQLGSAKLIEKYSRKKIMIMGAIFSALIWIPIMLTAMLFFNNISYTIWVLIGFVGIFHMIMGLIYPAWFSLMGSLVPEQERGKYFSRRNRYTQFFSVVSMTVSYTHLTLPTSG